MQMMRFPTLTTAIMQQYAVGFSDAAGSLLAMVLLGMCLLILTVEVLARGRSRIARVGRGSLQRPVLVAPARGRRPPWSPWRPSSGWRWLFPWPRCCAGWCGPS